MSVGTTYKRKEMSPPTNVLTFLNPVKHCSHVWLEQGRGGRRGCRSWFATKRRGEIGSGEHGVFVMCPSRAPARALWWMELHWKKYILFGAHYINLTWTCGTQDIVLKRFCRYLVNFGPKLQLVVATVSSVSLAPRLLSRPAWNCFEICAKLFLFCAGAGL